MFFKGDHLRVLTPKTNDGMNPIIGNDDQRVWKEDFLPISARRDLELQNKYLPDILKKKIEIIKEDQPGKDSIIKKK